MTSPKNWLEQMQAIEAAATKGPWEENTAFWANMNGPDEVQGAGPVHILLSNEIDSEKAWKDAAFIAASRQFVPKALECIRELAEELKIYSKEFTSDRYLASETLKKWGLE